MSKINKPVEIDAYIKRLTLINKLFKKGTSYYILNDNILINDESVVILFPEKIGKNSNNNLIFIKSLFQNSVKFTSIEKIYNIQRDKLYNFIKNNKNNISSVNSVNNRLIIETQNKVDVYYSEISEININEDLIKKVMYIYNNFNKIISDLIKIKQDVINQLFTNSYIFTDIESYKITLAKSMLPINSFKPHHNLYLYINKENKDLFNNQIVLINSDKVNYIYMTQYKFINF